MTVAFRAATIGHPFTRNRTESPLPLELLKEIAARPMPAVLKSKADIDKLRVLRASGLITAQIPEPDEDGPAEVLEITPLGRIALNIEDDPNN